MVIKTTEIPAVVELDSKEFRKANNAVSIRVKSGPTLSMMGRRLFNVLLYHAQNLGATGINAPEPWDACPNPADYYWIPLLDIAHDSSWGSKDHKLVVSSLQQLQTTLVESDDPTGRFSSVQLIGTVHLVKGTGRRLSLVGWEFPRSTRDILSNPDFYTKMSIFHLTSLQTAGGAALYEIAKRYLTNVDGKTSRKHWHWWHDTLTGKKIGSVAFPEYRYFKRDVLIPAIEEVNRTDINVALNETKIGRTVTDLQFLVSLVQQTSLELPPGPVVDSTLLERMRTIGFTEKQACELLGTTGDDYLRATIELVEERMADKTMEVLKAPAAFMRKALKDDYVSTVKIKRKPDPVESKPAKTKAGTPVDAKRKARVDKALAAFDALTNEARTKVLGKFYHAAATHSRLKLGGTLFRKTIGNWLVDNKSNPADSLFD